MERYRSFSLITYANVDEIKLIIDTHPNIKHYAYIYHNKDIKEDSTPVTPHYHVLLSTHNAMTCSAISKYFKLLRKFTTLAQHIHSDNIYNYLTHNGFEDKFQYSLDEVTSDDLSFWTQKRIETNTSYEIIEALNSNISLKKLAIIYGRDFILNYRKYREFADLVQFEEKFMLNNTDCTDVDTGEVVFDKVDCKLAMYLQEEMDI